MKEDRTLNDTQHGAVLMIAKDLIAQCGSSTTWDRWGPRAIQGLKDIQAILES